MKDNFSVSISSPPDRNFLVAEIMLSHEQLAELNQEQGILSLEIYPRRDGQPWQVNYDDMMQILTEAKNRLVGES